MSLVIISTHPIQYHAPVYRCLQQRYGVDVTVVYESDYSVAGYRDKDFGASFAWDTDLLSGYKSLFLTRTLTSEYRLKEQAGCVGLEAAMDKAQPEAVLILGYSVKLYQRAWYHARKKGYPVFFRMEAYDEPESFRFLKGAVRDMLLKFIYSCSQVFFYIGQASYQHYRRLGVPKDKLYFSPYVVDTTSFELDESKAQILRANKRQELGIHSDDVVIIFSGKLIKRKDPDIILKALRLLPPDVQRGIVVLYMGDGYLKSAINQGVKEAPLLRVILCGFKNQTQLSPFYHAADFLVLPSLYKETWGLVVNEAQAHGLPVVVSNHVGCRQDLVQPGLTGEVFKAGNAEDLAEAFLRVLKYIKTCEVRTRCLQQISKYNIDAAAKGIQAAYLSLVRKHG